MECSDDSSVWSNSLEDGASFRRRLEVALRSLNYTDGVGEFLRLYCGDHPLPPIVDFVESAIDEGFPLAHVIATLRERSRGFL